MVELVPVTFERRDELQRLLADYLHEFDGRTEPYPHFDAYWEEPERAPYFIVDGGDVAGLVLIRVLDGGWSIAEFSVVPARRRGGVGHHAVEALAQRARGAGAHYLEAKIHPGNGTAFLFWTACGFELVSSDGVLITRRAL